MPKLNKIPKNLQGVLWSANVDQLDIEDHKRYIIHQVLMYGSFADIVWLFTMYPPDIIKTVFTKYPLKVYTKEAFHFIKNYVLGLKKESLALSNYVNTIHERA